MSVTLDGFINDRDGDIGWTVPSDELFQFHLDRVRELGLHLCGRRLYETMLPWENDPSLPETTAEAEFAAVWTALPKVVFSRTLAQVQGNARLATGSVADEVAAARSATDKDIEIGGATLAAEAISLGLVDEFRIFRCPVIVGGGTPLLPAVSTTLPLRLIETRTFSRGQVLYERYGRLEAG